MDTVKYNSKQKKCSTCEYWVGNRTLTDNQDFVIVQSEVQGKCFGKYLRKLKTAKETNPCWKKWSILTENTNIELLRDLSNLIEKSRP